MTALPPAPPLGPHMPASSLLRLQVDADDALAAVSKAARRRYADNQLGNAVEERIDASERAALLEAPPPPPLPPVETPRQVTAADAQDEFALVLFALLSGTGTLLQRLQSRAFIMAIVGLIPSIVAGIEQAKQNLAPQYATALYIASFVLTAIYVAASRYENAATANAAAIVAVARIEAAKSVVHY